MWFSSQLFTEILETNEDATIYDCFIDGDKRKSLVNDFIELNVTKENYKQLIELADFLMVENADPFIDKIIDIHDYQYDIIYEFEDFYKHNTNRLIQFERLELINAIKLYSKNHVLCFQKYGFTSFWNVSNILNMNSLFYKFNPKYTIDISRWDVSNVIDMSDMFVLSNFDGDISKWDVSNVKYMNGMFAYSCFNNDISEWNTSNVIIMTALFKTSNFNSDISKWNTSNVMDTSSMFQHTHFTGDISEWDMSSVLNMSLMFQYSFFNGDISKWDVSNVGSLNCTFAHSNFNNDISKWNVENVESMIYTFCNLNSKGHYQIGMYPM